MKKLLLVISLVLTSSHNSIASTPIIKTAGAPCWEVGWNEIDRTLSVCEKLKLSFSQFSNEEVQIINGACVEKRNSRCDGSYGYNVSIVLEGTRVIVQP